MKHGASVDRCLHLLIPLTLAIAGGCGSSSADGEDAALLRTDGAVDRAGLDPHVGQQSSNVSPASNAVARLDTSLLREIELRVLPSPIINGPNRHAELPDYYWAENRLLRDRLESVKKAFRSEPAPAGRTLTLVAGAAGVGKTFIKGSVFDKDFPKAATCKFDIRELYDEWAEEGITTDKEDLATDDLVISRLKSVTDKSQPRLREYLESRGASFYVIDSLDEIHADDHVWVLEQVADFAFHRDRQFVHVAVFGRGFAFREFWIKRKEQLGHSDAELYLLNPPAFSTTGDLTVSSWNYHTWKYDLAWAPDGKETSKMPLDVYSRWVESGFSRQGTFQTVTCEDNNSMRPAVQNALAQCASEHQAVCGALCNLAGNSMIREILERETLERRPYDECQIGRAYLDRWLVRETKVHDRPSIEKPDHLDLYLSLLECVAVRYLRESAIDDRGYFPVRENDVVTAMHEGRERAFRVRNVLDGSGLIITDPRVAGVAKYRFEPISIQRLLVEAHGERMAKEQRLALGPCAK
ncbi:MAG: hypothetical protein ISR77_18120 [Pirellulaceae bacterium]|nr:hypothetical protein [Pirellulaceae bacterium]